MNSEDFPEAGTIYLLGKRAMSRGVFERNVIAKVERRLRALEKGASGASALRRIVRMEYGELGKVLGVTKSTAFGNLKNGWNLGPLRDVLEKERKRQLAEGKSLLLELRAAHDSDAIAVKIERIEPVPASGLFYDMEVDKRQNFIANGLVVHNSANRYARVREGLLEDHLKKVGEIASGFFKQQKDLQGVVIGGPGPIKEQFAGGEFLEYTVKAKVLGTVNTAYTGEEGLEEMIARSEELLRDAKGMKERKVLDRFFEELAKDGPAVYGLVETVRALRAGNLGLLLLSEKFAWEEVKGKCSSCGDEATHVVERAALVKCMKCGGKVVEGDRTDLEQVVLKLAEQMGTHVELVSTDSPKGEQLLALGGIGGIQRYKA